MLQCKRDATGKLILPAHNGPAIQKLRHQLVISSGCTLLPDSTDMSKAAQTDITLELLQLWREANTLNLFTSLKCELAVQLAGICPVVIEADTCWFVMELLEGENMESVLRNSCINDIECIKVISCSDRLSCKIESGCISLSVALSLELAGGTQCVGCTQGDACCRAGAS